MNVVLPAPHIDLPLDAGRILTMLPHRYPFLLVDRVIEFEPNKRLCAIKNVSMNEPFFQGHFPAHPVMPGVLIIEALAQAAGLLSQLSNVHTPNPRALFYLAKVDKARFSQIVSPGDQLTLKVTQKRRIRRMGLFEGQALVDEHVVAEAELLCSERNDG